MSESERKYHEVANIFPLMQGEEYDGLKATGITEGKVFFLQSSDQNGYTYFWWFEKETDCLSGFDKPVSNAYLTTVLSHACVPDGTKWNVIHCDPLSKSPLPEEFHQKAIFENQIYFIKGYDKVKIGRASFPITRLDALRTGSPVPLTLLGFVPERFKSESSWHIEFHHIRSHGEWFYLTEELEARIHEHISEYS